MKKISALFGATNLSIFLITSVTLFVLFAVPTTTFASKDYGALDTGYDLGGYGISPNYYESAGGYGISPNYYEAYSSPSYSYPSYSSPSYGGYSYTPSQGYSYVPSRGGSSYTPSYSTPNYQYMYSSNTNQNTNTNTNTNNNSATASNTNTITNNPVNVFNPTNNNDARINLVVLGGGTNTPYTPPQQQTLDAVCVISPSTVYVGQEVSFYVNATGGYGSYTYYWSGDNGINSTSQSFTGRFSYPGYKTATVTVTSGGQTITRTCSVNVQGNTYATPYPTPTYTYPNQSNVTVIRQPDVATPVSGIYLSQVPSTGISFGLKMTLFTVGILLWSLFAAYIINAKRNKTLSLATSGNADITARIEAFKQRNLLRKTQ